MGDAVSPSVSITAGSLLSGDALDTATFTYEGTNGTTYGPSTTTPTAIGTYSVTPSALTLSSGNIADYTVTYVAGSLSINEVDDADGDGLDDDSDPFPYSVTMMQSGTLTLRTEPPTRLSACSLQSVSTSDVATSMPGVAENGSGVAISFRLSGCDQSNPEDVRVAIDLGEAPSLGSVAYKIDSNGDWSRILGAEIVGTVVTYSVADNGPLDTDPNPGVIDDPITVAVPTETAVPVPALAVFFWPLVILVGLLGIRYAKLGIVEI